MFVKISNQCPDPVVSLYYNNYLIPARNGHKSQESELRNILYFYTWCEEVDKQVSEILLDNRLFTRTDLNSFSQWLRKRGTKTKTTDDDDIKKHPYKQIDGNNYRSIIYSTATFLNWAVNFLFFPEGVRADSVEILEKRLIVKESIKEWQKEKKNAVPRKMKLVVDLSDEEIINIDKSLHPNLRNDTNRSSVVRDYLLWRIALEFGARKGEILCLETIDMPEGQQEYLNIRRTDERGSDYYDPRTNPPRVKTLSRFLPLLLPDAPYNADHSLKNNYEETILSCSHVKHWWTEYAGYHRPISTKHKFAFCEHADGERSPLADLSRLVNYIKTKTGIKKFHAHICRHSLFNRIFMTKIDSDSYEQDIKDIKYYGGWISDKSIEIYTTRARADLAKGYSTRFQASEKGWGLTRTYSKEAKENE
jgi:integrase